MILVARMVMLKSSYFPNLKRFSLDKLNYNLGFQHHSSTGKVDPLDESELYILVAYGHCCLFLHYK